LIDVAAVAPAAVLASGVAETKNSTVATTVQAFISTVVPSLCTSRAELGVFCSPGVLAAREDITSLSKKSVRERFLSKLPGEFNELREAIVERVRRDRKESDD
jgi:hypothetical protein